MSRSAARLVAALMSGLLFGLGLVVSGMTQPAKVRAFLDVFGAWDPSLACVMAGAIGVHAVALRVLDRRTAPFAGGAFSRAGSAGIDARLVVGAAVFGAGWGLSGYCPGPSLVALPASGAAGLVFVASLALGNLVAVPRRLPRFGRPRSELVQS